MTGEGYQISYGATFFGIGTSTSTAYDNTVTIRFDVGNGVTAPAPPEGLVRVPPIHR